MGTVEWSGTRAVFGHKAIWQQPEAQKASLLGTAVEEKSEGTDWNRQL